MDRSAGLALRWFRAALLAIVSVAGSIAGHVSADGLLPTWPALVVLCLVTVAAAAALLGRPASTARVVLLLVVGQALAHLALTASAGHRGDPVSHGAVAAPRELPDLAYTGRRVGSLHDQLYPDQPVVTHLAVPVPVQHVLADLTGPNALMALGHLAAAAAVGLWLAQGERAVWTVLTLTVAGLRELVHASIVSFVALLRTFCEILAAAGRCVRLDRSEQTDRASRLLLLARTVTRRGPPHLLAA